MQDARHQSETQDLRVSINFVKVISRRRREKFFEANVGGSQDNRNPAEGRKKKSIAAQKQLLGYKEQVRAARCT